jgi:iron complex outermembrane receptor protein
VSQELRLASNGNRPLSMSRPHYFRQVITGQPISIYSHAPAVGSTTSNGTAIPANLLDGYGQTGQTRFAVNSYAAFAEANWKVLPRVTLTGGLRQTWEDKNGQYATTVLWPTTSNAALISARFRCCACNHAAATHDASLSGRANLAWQVTDRVMAYVGYAQGSRRAGSTCRACRSTAPTSLCWPRR